MVRGILLIVGILLISVASVSGEWVKDDGALTLACSCLGEYKEVAKTYDFKTRTKSWYEARNYVKECVNDGYNTENNKGITDIKQLFDAKMITRIDKRAYRYLLKSPYTLDGLCK